ncbi:MAG: hypothetical protein M5U34_19710 [Chloroflexi bacterium]|nr:hypothetical protein [Chloroflexota bacterium]
MLNSIRSRLLLSYLVVIAVALLAVVVALFYFTTLPGLRYEPTLQQLATVSRVNRPQLARLIELGAGIDNMKRCWQKRPFKMKCAS